MVDDAMVSRVWKAALLCKRSIGARPTRLGSISQLCEGHSWWLWRWRARWPFGGQSHIDNVLQNNECHNKAGGLDSEDKTIIKRRKEWMQSDDDSDDDAAFGGMGR